MTGYIVEEPENDPIHYTDKGEESNEYWRIYSPKQKKRFSKVIKQFNDIWFSVFNQLKFIRDYVNKDDCNNLMLKVHKIFFIKHNELTDYYNEERMKTRKNKNYISKKINKIKNKKNTI